MKFIDEISWYNLWAAGVAMNGMCARDQKAGQARYLGML